MRYKIFTIEEWDYVCKRMNWAKSTFDAKAIQILNKPTQEIGGN